MRDLDFKPGGEATLHFATFLAYGLVGDGKKIPPRTIIVYRYLYYLKTAWILRNPFNKPKMVLKKV